MLTDRPLVSQREIPLTLWDKRQRISDLPLLIPIPEWVAKQFHRGREDIFAVSADGAVTDTHLGSEVLISLLLNHLLEATYPLRKISALSGSLSPGSQSQS